MKISDIEKAINESYERDNVASTMMCVYTKGFKNGVMWHITALKAEAHPQADNSVQSAIDLAMKYMDTFTKPNSSRAYVAIGEFVEWLQELQQT